MKKQITRRIVIGLATALGALALAACDPQAIKELEEGVSTEADVVARFGGEEFCVIAPGLAPQEAFALFDAFRCDLSKETFEFCGETVSITISIGVSTAVVDNIDTMIAAADTELYRAKQQGRNRVLVA